MSASAWSETTCALCGGIVPVGFRTYATNAGSCRRRASDSEVLPPFPVRWAVAALAPGFRVHRSTGSRVAAGGALRNIGWIVHRRVRRTRPTASTRNAATLQITAAPTTNLNTNRDRPASARVLPLSSYGEERRSVNDACSLPRLRHHVHEGGFTALDDGDGATERGRQVIGIGDRPFGYTPIDCASFA